MLDKHVVGTSHRADPALKAALVTLLVVTQVEEHWDCGRQRSKKGDLVAVRSFPKTS